MAGDKWKFYNPYCERVFKNDIDDEHTYKMMLLSSASNCTDLTLANKADLTNEIASANGYTAGGATLQNFTVTRSAAVTKLDCDDASWTASGGNIAARYAVIYDDTHASDALVCFALLDNTPADLVSVSGQTFDVRIHNSGIGTIQANNT